MTAHKNSGNTTAGHWQNTVVFFSLMAMIVSLYISRGALSVSIVIFLLAGFAKQNIPALTKKFIASPFLLAFSFLFFIPFLSGLWSDDINTWAGVVRIKLPLLFFPLAFAANWQLSPTRWLIVAFLFLSTVFAGCLLGLIDYSQHSAAVHEGYLRAKTILTPLENDHVRFSWLVSAAVILCLLLAQQITQRFYKIAVVALAVFFISYLHILSARTGVLSLYIFLLLYAGWLLVKSERRGSLFLVLLLLVLPLLAYFLLPTFKARLQYNLYDLSFAQKAEYLPGSSDGARTMSLKAGWLILQNYPLGAGAGDITKEADKWYAANVPQVLPSDKFYPSSEWLMYGGFAGWPGVLAFTLIMAVPFFISFVRYRIFWIAFHATAAFSFAFDMGLEVQYGVFLYGFMSCWWWKWLVNTTEKQLRFSDRNKLS